MNQDLTKLRAFVQARLSSGIHRESLSLMLLDCLPTDLMTRAVFKALNLPWPLPAIRKPEVLSPLVMDNGCTVTPRGSEDPFNGLVNDIKAIIHDTNYT